jgi:hypothetical protein
MIITENLTIGGKDFTKKYSDKSVYIENESGQQYAEAIDLVDYPHAYTETDIPIEGDTGDDTEQKAAAFDYLTGRGDSDE